MERKHNFVRPHCHWCDGEIKTKFVTLHFKSGQIYLYFHFDCFLQREKNWRFLETDASPAEKCYAAHKRNKQRYRRKTRGIRCWRCSRKMDRKGVYCSRCLRHERERSRRRSKQP